MKDIDQNILELARQGHIGAFEDIYKETSGFVYNVALRITRNSADAQEVTQNVFLKIYRNLKSFAFRSAFKTWVYRITVNTAINYYRKSMKEQKRRVDFDDIAPTLANSSVTSENVIKSDNESRLQSLLGLLSLEHKACLVLREIEGLSYQEIAVSLRIPINTVRSRLKRARQALLEEARKGRKDAL